MTYRGALCILSDEISNLIQEVQRELIVVDKLRSGFVWILIKIIGKFEGWGALFYGDIKDIIVFFSAVLSLQKLGKMHKLGVFITLFPVLPVASTTVPTLSHFCCPVGISWAQSN